MKKLIFIFFAICIFLFTPSVLADNDGCNGQYGQYGGCNPSLSIVVDKLVGKPDNNLKDATNATYVDNLSVSDIRFKPSQLVFFKIKVKNTSTQTLNNIVLKDTVPWYIDPLDGPGTFDSSNRVITYTVGDLTPDQEKVFYMKMQVFPQNQLAANQGLFCISNKVQVSNDSVFDNDTSQFCIEKQVVGTTTVPSSGPEFGLILMGLNMLGLGAGLMIKRKTG